MSTIALWNPAGGLRYHLRALQYGSRLLGFAPAAKTLVLVGPSGGYCLQPFFFERFDRVVCLEPDPLARLIFRRNLDRAPLDHRPKLEFIAEDHLVNAPERLPKLLDGLGDAALLFTNVIGQLRSLLGVDSAEDARLRRVREQIALAVEGRAFASFHDRLSGLVRPHIESPHRADARLDDDHVLAEFYQFAEFGQRRRGLELLDHLTGGFFPSALPHTYFVWEILPGRFHLIEGVARSRIE
jgi:hypothetical protein